jgi:hypothetical protein
MSLLDQIAHLLNENTEKWFDTYAGRKFPIAYRQNETGPVVCPYCGREHHHGTADGHRSSHCPTSSHGRRLNLEGEIVTPADGYLVLTRLKGTRKLGK